MAAHFGRRLRKGAATTAVAAAAVAALSASQAPGATGEGHGRQTAAGASTPIPDAVPDGDATGSSPYYTDLPPLHSPDPRPSSTAGTPVSRGEAEAGIPATVLDAYKKAEAELRATKPGCNLPWQLLAAIGKVESGQARGGRVDAAGTTLSPILGPQLDGNGFALIPDTDHGAYDGNSRYDQAVGPMQFIPSTWAWAGRDGNGDGRKDPNNVYDAALAAGHYLCRNSLDLSHEADLHRAILSYNHSQEYLNLVLNWLEYYRKGSHAVPDGTGSVPSHRSDSGIPHSRSPQPSDPPKTQPSHPSKAPSENPPAKKPAPKPDKPSGGKESPDPKPSKPSVPPTPPQTPTDTVDQLQDADTAKLTAMAGDTFTARIGTRAETKAGKPVGKVRIRFTITGDTNATFTGGETVATVVTDAQGTALAPALQAGEKTGDFEVTATVVGRSVKGVDYTATVTARAADTLVRTGDTPLVCTPGGEFAEQIQVKATYKGAVADKTEVTVTLIKSAGDDTPGADGSSQPTGDDIPGGAGPSQSTGDDTQPADGATSSAGGAAQAPGDTAPSGDGATENDKGPYFKDVDGKAVRTVTGLWTDDQGLLTLPKLYADDTTGTFLLRITTPGGGTLVVKLEVAAGDSAPSPSPSPSASS
ncbi:lytic transglycosylase domain-containing protein [Streptomyces sp. MUM 16J]|uniref:lytic transglycosylase domain-containing protein n=1 Tax=Streptomyces sp. MUM 16J TaxID=2791988 RepID=UPI001F045A5D|nr:lytic murein transglycosylase [Streptomyces sp. MUM 16J]MCH0555844.1 lytic transglycosylase domain-containing protein [Streptomyces sp. MUM 16J]